MLVHGVKTELVAVEHDHPEAVRSEVHLPAIGNCNVCDWGLPEKLTESGLPLASAVLVTDE